MNLFLALVEEVPSKHRGHPVVFHDLLPNGIPYMATHPSNLDFMIGMAQEKSVQIQRQVSVVVIDLKEILESDFVSPDTIPWMPDWYSVN